MRVTGDIKVRDGLVFLDGWVVCECGSVECDTAETLIRQLREGDRSGDTRENRAIWKELSGLKVCAEHW
jgi:hypothetical protein